MTLSNQKYPRKPHIEALTKDVMCKYLPNILTEVRGFRYISWEVENYLKELPGKWNYSLAATIEQTICGFSVNSDKSGLLYVHFFYVFKNYRKIGIGKYLLIACENICREENIRAIQLKCHKNNSNAKRFYERNGFDIIGIDEKKDNYYIMRKQIS